MGDVVGFNLNVRPRRKSKPSMELQRILVLLAADDDQVFGAKTYQDVAICLARDEGGALLDFYLDTDLPGPRDFAPAIRHGAYTALWCVGEVSSKKTVLLCRFAKRCNVPVLNLAFLGSEARDTYKKHTTSDDLAFR